MALNTKARQCGLVEDATAYTENTPGTKRRACEGDNIDLSLYLSLNATGNPHHQLSHHLCMAMYSILSRFKRIGGKRFSQNVVETLPWTSVVNR